MAAGTATSTLLPPVKRVVVYKNGDPFYCGRRFVVNQRQVSTMEAFLTEVTQSIGASLAVRNLYTPRQGHRVTDLQELRTGAQYVAAVIQNPNVSAKWRKFIPIPCIIHVFRNGDLLCPPFRFIIPRNMQQDLEQILSLVTDKVSLRTGAVRRLCSLEGVPLSSASELKTGHSYVAVGTERFKKLPYEELLVSKAAERYCYASSYVLNGTEDRYSDSALLNSPASDGRRVKSTGDDATPPQASQQRYRGVNPEHPSAFFSRQVKVRKNRGHPLTNGAAQHSVFKRAGRKRREEVRGAEEVAEDENTATEIPIDQVSELADDNQETFEQNENKIRISTKHEETQVHINLLVL
uniref:Doublecortin domain-containing protein n=1 Tax=Periophthalmus magnuspinnatus TaxID=409849 RepID=A0A3B4A7W7_9GOBI